MENSENFDIELFEQEDEVAEDEADSRVEIQLFRKVATPETKLLSLAFTVPDTIPPRQLTGSCLVWTREAMAAFAAIYKVARDVSSEYVKNFPFAFLRGAFEVQLPGAIRLKPDMGLSRYELAGFGKLGTRELSAFAYLESTAIQGIARTIKPLLNNWIINNLIPQYAKPGNVEEKLTNRVIDLAQSGGLVSVRLFESKALPWSWDNKTGTTRSADALSFQALADLVAKTLAGKELFQGLGPMHRLISASGRSNCAELVTKPKRIEEHGRLSFVVSLSVETMPSLHQPLLVMDVSKRRWLDSLDDTAFDRSHISGTVFSEKHNDRAFRFQMRRRPKTQGDGWIVDNAYDAIRGALTLPVHVTEASELLRGSADTQTAKVYLSYRPGISEDRQKIQAGVPERDKLEAFTEAAAILSELGLQPFKAMKSVKVVHTKAYEAGARMIETSTLLSALLERAAASPTDAMQLSPNYLKSLSEDRLRSLLLEHFQVSLDEVAKAERLRQGARKGTPASHMTALEQLIKQNREALGRLYGDPLPDLVLFHEDGPHSDRDLKLLIAAIKLLAGDLQIECNRLPCGTHGPEAELDSRLPNGKRAPAMQRSQRRIEAWKNVADQMRRSGKRHLCLVMARALYEDPTGLGAPKRDDRVNKPSTRRALASAGSAVQFLLPPHAPRGMVRLSEFLMRLQAALKDLLWAHRGRIDGVLEAVEACFPDPKTRPREIIGITIVRKESGRVNVISSSFLPVAIRLDAATGMCSLRFGYESSSGAFTTSPWEQFSDALSRIARLSPVKLAEDPRERRSRFMRFVEEVIGGSVDDGAQPVVLVDSSNVVSLWPWLADSRITVDDVSLGERQWMQEEWAGARIIRLRHGLAPCVIQDKRIELTETWHGDARPIEELEAKRSIMVTTSPGGGLFRIETHASTGCITYLSIGKKTLHHQKRGLSCYRGTELPAKIKVKIDGRFVQDPTAKNAAGAEILRTVSYPAHIGQWPSPQPLEVVVTLRQKDDAPDRMAEFVERLRYGFGHYQEWTTLPAPLFFERVIRDYISQFEIEDAESAEAEESTTHN